MDSNTHSPGRTQVGNISTYSNMQFVHVRSQGEWVSSNYLSVDFSCAKFPKKRCYRQIMSLRKRKQINKK